MPHKNDKARIFHTLWLWLGSDDFEIVAEYPYSVGADPIVPGRKFRVDFAFPTQKLIVEVDGGVYGFKKYNKKTGRIEYQRGGHSTISGQLLDMERGNLLAANGWRIMRFTPDQLEKTPHDCIAIVLQALNVAGAKDEPLDCP